MKVKLIVCTISQLPILHSGTVDAYRYTDSRISVGNIKTLK